MSLEEIEEVVFSDNKRLDIRDMPDDSSTIINIIKLVEVYIK